MGASRAFLKGLPRRPMNANRTADRQLSWQGLVRKGVRWSLVACAAALVFAAAGGCTAPGPKNDPRIGMSFTLTGWVIGDATWHIPRPEGRWNLTETRTFAADERGPVSFQPSGRTDTVGEKRQGSRVLSGRSSFWASSQGPHDLSGSWTDTLASAPPRTTYMTVENKECNPPWPRLEVGVHWTFNCTSHITESNGPGAQTERTSARQVSLRVVASETVTVPAGTFQAWRIQFNRTVEGIDHSGWDWVRDGFCGDNTYKEVLFDGPLEHMELQSFTCGTSAGP